MGVKKVLEAKSKNQFPKVKVETCYGKYLWIGEEGSMNPLVVETKRDLNTLKRAINALLKPAASRVEDK